jgi:hypothetical protein
MSSAVNAQLRVHRLFPATTARRLLAPFSRIARPAWRVTDRATRSAGPWRDGQHARSSASARDRPAGRTMIPDSAPALFRRNLSGMRRSVVDYGLARRATLASVFAGRTTVTDVCDAHPYLLRAAKFHGEPTNAACPICRKAKLTHVTYVYGDELGRYEGRVKQGPELAEMATEYAEFRVYVVEVCQSCSWNHLASSYVLGTGEQPARRSRRARAGE